MNTLYSTLIATVAFVVFAAVAVADPGTTWDTVIKDKGRFVVLKAFNDAAVLDTETGRVWEQSPSTSEITWFDALIHCYQLEVSGRKGWRLPTIEELASLVDTSQPAPTLPAGHPFSNVQSVQSSFYWSSTTLAGFTSNAWVVTFFSGFVGSDIKSLGNFVWCVRGGQGIDGVQ
jgi:hypothetical protein